ncbi:choice-of-anchor B family protein [Rheinheimera sp. WS51]|uniref:choice-of-anchor B family protein n=1 Tax=Rheinheimera sp. WS51 TaxID=3425886 RepID=UPI003D8A49AA
MPVNFTFLRLAQGLLAASAITLALMPQNAEAHAEHDKARFVAIDGQDIGRCDKPLRPCQSIGYAVKQANKGDKVLVAAGHYSLADEDQLFYLISEIVPVLGGYSRIDHYQLQAPEINHTTLGGVPAELQEQLQQRGFYSLRDGKATVSAALQTKLAQHQSLQTSQSAQQCVDGKAGNFSCSNIDLVGHVALADFSTRPSAANDIWGHVDLNTGTEYALIGLTNGTAVVNLATPDAPQVTGIIRGSTTSWRDIKVYQYFDQALRRWQAYAYVSSEGSDGIQIIDLTRLPSDISLAATYRGVTSSHNVFISGIDYSTNTRNSAAAPLLHIVGQNTQRGAVTTLSLANPTQLSPVWQQNTALRSDYTHDVATLEITDNRAISDCKQSPCQLLFDFNEQEVKLWDASIANEPSKLAQFSYDQASYVHSGWATEDNRYLFVHDELDEVDFSLKTTLHIFALDDLRNPVLQSVWRGPTRAIDHNGFVRGNRYYMSNYQRGLTILDISNPASPIEAGYFDTFLPSDGAAFNGMWGTYPYLPSGVVLGSDINSGLYILADNTKETAAGTLSFSQSAIEVTPGQVAQIKVQRPTGSGAVSVAYHSLAGSAEQGTDYEAISGRLNWSANDHNDKLISLATLDRGEDGRRSVFVRLFDPQGGVTLASPAMATITFGTEPARPGTLSIVAQSIEALEGESVDVTVQRLAGSDGAISVAYSLAEGTAQAETDYIDISGQLSWADGDSSDKSFTISLLDDTEQEQDEVFTAQIHSVDASVISPNNSLSITILDNDLNTAPQISGLENIEVNASQNVSITATAVDAENDNIEYQWQQVSGTNVNLQNATTNTVSFVAPASSAALSLRVSATDSRGASSHATVLVTVVALPAEDNQDNKSGGSSAPISLLLLISLYAWRRRQ